MHRNVIQFTISNNTKNNKMEGFTETNSLFVKTWLAWFIILLFIHICFNIYDRSTIQKKWPKFGHFLGDVSIDFLGHPPEKTSVVFFMATLSIMLESRMATLEAITFVILLLYFIMVQSLSVYKYPVMDCLNTK